MYFLDSPTQLLLHDDTASYWIFTNPHSIGPRLDLDFRYILFVIGLLLITMSKKCCVPCCNKTRSDNVTLHLFPNPDEDLDRFNVWKTAIGGEILSMDNHSVFKLRRVCHLHFESNYNTWSNRLTRNAVPTLQLTGSSTSSRGHPMQDITNRILHGIDQVQSSSSILQPSASSTSGTQAVSSTSSRGHPMQDITNRILHGTDQVQSSSSILQPSAPSTSGTQADVKSKIRYISPDVSALRKKIRSLQKAKETSKIKLKKALKLTENITFLNTLKKFTVAAMIFTMMQFREAGKKKMGRRFKQDEKLLALFWYKQGPRAYRWLRKMFVLPSPLTLSRMITNAGLRQGINNKLFKQLKKRAEKMTTNEKLCILMFDEIALSAHLDYNKKTDAIIGLANGKKIADHALVFMMRGVFKNYKQPLAYSFCSKTTPKEDLVVKIKEVIQKLHECGFKVIATVCDQGSTNVSALNYLINERREKLLRQKQEVKNATFEVDGHEIIPLYDPPHLLKGIRNNLLNKDLTCLINGKAKCAKWDHILKLYKENPAYQGIRLMPKLTEKHVIPKKIAKMKVKCATQVFSQTVAANMGYLASHGILPKECEETADVLIFFDKLFDSINGSYNKSNKKSGKPLLGPVTPNSPHKKVWLESRNILKTMKYVIGDTVKAVPSIKNWIVTLENIELIVDKLSQEYGLTSLWMRHFNQDPLENFFGSIRSHGYRNTSPTCAGFEAAFASLLVNNISNIHSLGANCEEDSCKVLKSLKNIFFTPNETSSHMSTNVELNYEDVLIEFIDVNEKIKNAKIKAQLEYVTGYVLRILKSKIFKNCEVCKKSLISENKEGSSLISREYFSGKSCLTYPSMEILKCFSYVQDVFTLIIRKDYGKNNLRIYIKTVLSVVMNYSFINCQEHRESLINMFEDSSIIFFLCNWCKDNNKLLKGIRTDYDKEDQMQKMCVNYFKINSKKCREKKILYSQMHRKLDT